MLTEKEKTEIAERVRFEHEVRKSLPTDPESKPTPWWEGKLFLLVAGAVITGFLVPLFQCTQSTLTWKRQNRYDAVQSRLSSMRDCSREVGKVPSLLAQAYEEARPLIEGAAISKEEYDAFKKRFIAIQASRFEQNAKISSLLGSFEGSSGIEDDFHRYIALGSGRMRLLEKAVADRMSRAEVEESKAKIDETTIVSADLYDSIALRMKNAITEVENEISEYR
jgi:hypothetical protein